MSVYKHREFVAYVEEHEDITPAALGEYFGVSERTVRTYVSRSNKSLGGCARVIKRRGDGYHIQIEDPTGFAHWKSRDRLQAPNAIPSTHEERVRFVLNDLLSRAGWITLDQLASILYVSHNTVSNDMHEVEEKLGRYGLELQRKPYYGIRVKGSEIARRRCMADLATQRMLDKLDLTDRASDAVSEVSQIVERVASEENFQINSAAYQNLIVHIVIAVARIRKNSYVPMAVDQIEQMRTTREFEVARRIAEQIGERFHITLPEGEVAYITVHLAAKQSFYEGDATDGLVISDEVWDIVSKMLDMVWTRFHYDFRGDLELRMNLARHIVPLTVRLQYHLQIKNPLLTDIKHRFQLAYSMAVHCAPTLSELHSTELTEDEMGYLALSFQLALERMRTELPRKNILVVCASGQGSARLLEWSYLREFGPYLNKVVACDVLHVKDVDFSHIDYVFTTVPIKEKLPVPVRQVSYFLGPDEIQGVRDFLTCGDGISEAATWFSSSLFFAHVNADSREEVLDFLCEEASRQIALPSSFRASVARREEVAKTSFGNRVAMPHPMELLSPCTFVAVALLDRSIDWGGEPVRAVFLICVTQEHGDMQTFYQSLTKLFSSADAIGSLLADQSFERLMSLL